MTSPQKQSFTPLEKPQSSSPLAQRPVQIGLLLGLAAVLALVVFLLPNWIAQEQPVTPIELEPSSNGNTAVGSKESPWQDAQQAKIRRQAQDLLAKMLPIQEQLEQQNVEAWARLQYQDALKLALAADKLYKSQQFDQALQQYQASLSALEAIYASREDVFKHMIQQGQEALQAHQSDQAKEAFTIASQLDLGAEYKQQAQTLLQRAEVLNEVLDLLSKGDRFKKQQQWANAVGLYRQAVKLDPNSEQAKTALQQAEQLLTDDKFGAAMSQAYSAMQTQQYQLAEKHFKQALTIEPSAGDAKAGLQQAREKILHINIQHQTNSGKRYSQAEQWQKAVDAYQAALKFDASSVDAKVGLIKARARLELDQKLITTLANQDQLQDSYKRKQAEQLLQQARQTKPAGNKLSEQISTLQVALIKASSPVPVILRSDGLTQVHIYKVKRFAPLQSTQLDLVPGRYTAVGSRAGYRDIRVEFAVAHGQANAVEVICREPI